MKIPKKLLTQYLNWISSMIPEDISEERLRELRVRALYLARVCKRLDTYGIYVPYLKYHAYKNLVASIISVADEIATQIRDYQYRIELRKQEELVIDVGTTLNENIQNSGRLLSDYIGVMAEEQRKMTQYYDDIILQQEQDLKQAIKQMGDLESLLKEQQSKVNDAVEKYKTAVANWETMEIIKFSLTIATDLFSLGTSIFIPSSSIKAVEDLGEMAQKIQKLLNVLNTLSKLMQDVAHMDDAIDQANKALASVKDGVDIPSSRAWTEFGINMGTVLSNGPNIPEKNELKAAFDILILRAKSLLETKSKVQQLTGDIYLNKKRNELNKNEAKALEQLKKNLNVKDIHKLDKNAIDLIGLTGKLEFIQKQILLTLSKTLTLQDEALQYEYLQKPVTIQSFNILGLKRILFEQQENMVHALERLNPPPKPVDSPIIYEIHGVKATDLINGNIYNFIIHQSAKEFYRYAMVRIDKVVAEIDGIEKTDSGEHLIELHYEGNPFEDRDDNRKELVFNTVERVFGPYLYNTATGKAQFGDQTGKFEENISQVTPFSTWKICLPKTLTNKGISFKDDFVTVRLIFNITALFKDPKELMPPANALCLQGTSLPEVIAEMYTKEAVLRDWDVVFNLMEDKVNELFLKQYHNKKNNPNFVRYIPEQQFCEEFPGGVKVYTNWSLSLAAPQIQFLQNNSQYVRIHMDIIGGYIQKGSQVNDGKIFWGEKESINSGAFIEGNVEITHIQGVVQDGKVENDLKSSLHHIVTNISNGAFSANNLKVVIDDSTFNSKVSYYFTQLNTNYLMGTIDFTNKTLLPALTPNKFLFNVLTTDSGKNILQLFITTTGKQQSNQTILLNEPIPDGYGCSLIISSRLVFGDIFTQSFNSSGRIKIRPNNPGNNFKAWSVSVTEGNIRGTVRFSGRSDLRISRNSNDVIWDLDGMIFSRSQTSALTLSYTKQKNQSFQYRQPLINT